MVRKVSTSPKWSLIAKVLLTCTSPIAATLSGGFVPTPYPLADSLKGLDSAEGAASFDTYDFAVTSAGAAAAACLDFASNSSGVLGAIPLVFTAMVLADSSNNALPGAHSVDTDGSVDWSVTAAVPGAGTYRVLLQGTAPSSTVDPAPSQFYLGLLATQVNVVPDPGTYGLMAMGLLALAGLRRRQ